MDLETFLVSPYVVVDEWWKRHHPRRLQRVGRPPALTEAEVPTLAVLARWPRFRSERDLDCASLTRTSGPTSPTSSARANSRQPHACPRTRTASPAGGPGRHARRRLGGLRRPWRIESSPPPEVSRGQEPEEHPGLLPGARSASTSGAYPARRSSRREPGETAARLRCRLMVARRGAGAMLLRVQRACSFRANSAAADAVLCSGSRFEIPAVGICVAVDHWRLGQGPSGDGRRDGYLRTGGPEIPGRARAHRGLRRRAR